MSKLAELQGQRFGRLLIMMLVRVKGIAKWQCQCDCGRTLSVTTSALRHHKKPVRSCGCMRWDTLRPKMLKHGRAGTREYGSWCAMIQRCTNPNNQAFKNYGGRGIQVCEQWRNDFAAFFSVIGERPSPCHTLERIDNDGHYEPGNVKWATRHEQLNNKRTNRKLVVNGEVLTIRQAALKFGLSINTLQSRLKLGWHMQDACLLPSGTGKYVRRATAATK